MDPMIDLVPTARTRICSYKLSTTENIQNGIFFLIAGNPSPLSTGRKRERSELRKYLADEKLQLFIVMLWEAGNMDVQRIIIMQSKIIQPAGLICIISI